MKAFSIIIICLCLFTFSAKAQTFVNTNVHTTTSVAVEASTPVSTQLSNVRYEFVQSTLNTTHAFLVDKYTGRVWRYRILKKEFTEITREEPDIVNPEVVNYQLYMSGENSSMCFLLNVHTGEMWRYGSKDGEKTFRKMGMPWTNKEKK